MSPRMHMEGPAARARRALLDQAGLSVRVPDAFRGFAPSAAYDEVLAALGRRKRADVTPYTGERRELLRDVVCGHLLPDGTPCGRRIPARYGVQRPDDYRYHSENCSASRWPHSASFPPCVEDAVVAVVADVLSPAALANAVRALRLAPAAQRTRERVLERAYADAVRQEAAAARRVLQADAARQTGAAERWERARAELADRASGLARELAQVRDGDAGGRAGRAQVLERVAALAADLPELLEAARAVPGLAQGVIAACVRRVTLQRLSGGVCSVEVAFPMGRPASRLVLTDPVRASQPVLAYVVERIAAGAAPEAVSAHLNAHHPASRGDLRWDPDRVLTADYQARLFDPVGGGPAGGKSFAALAARLGIDEAVALRAAFAGALGPAAVAGGVVAVAPTRAQVHRAFPDVALRDVARDLGYAECDLVPLAEVLRGVGPTRDARLALARRLVVARDKAGRRYGRAADIAEAVEAAGRRQRRSTTAARRRLATPTPASTSLADAVAALPSPALPPDEFVPREDLLQQLRARLGFPSRTLLHAAVAAGAVPNVRAAGVGLGGRRLPRQHYTWCPAAVREGSIADMRTWLAGGWPRPGGGGDTSRFPRV